MILKQLKFDFEEDLITTERQCGVRWKLNPNKIYPDDITFFIDKYLPEYKEGILDGTLSEGMLRLPRLEAVHNVETKNLIPFNALMSFDAKKSGGFDFFHFFVHDYQFERVWRNPARYLPFFLKIGQGIGPDFSMYLYMHPTEAAINCCRNRILAFYLQKLNITIVPNVCFGDVQTFQWAFDGLPEHSVLALTSQSCICDNISKRTLVNGIHELVRRKHPELLYVYGQFPEEWKDKFGVEIISLPVFSSKWRRAE